MELMAIYDAQGGAPFESRGCLDGFATALTVARAGVCKPTHATRATVSAPADNMRIVKYQPKGSLGGYDGGLELGILGSWDYGDSQRTFALLDSCKESADDGRINQSYVDFGGRVWRVEAKGANVGGTKYKWVMVHHGVKVYIHGNPQGDIRPIRVRFGAECLYNTDVKTAYETLVDVLAAMGFCVESEVISRVDFQIMLFCPITDFFDAMSGGTRIVTKCRGKLCIYQDLTTGKLESLTIRSSTQELCIYDKLAEFYQQTPENQAIFRRALFPEELPQNLTRVEFRFRRQVLRRYGINSLDDLFRSQNALINIADSEWFRILSRDKVRGSETEIPVAPIWSRVVKAFNDWFPAIEAGERPPRPKAELKAFSPVKESPKVSRLVAQAVGLLSRVVSLRLPSFENSSAVCKEAVKYIQEKEGVLFQKVLDKSARAEVDKGFNSHGRENYSRTPYYKKSGLKVRPDACNDVVVQFDLGVTKKEVQR